MNKKHFLVVILDDHTNGDKTSIESILNKALDWIEITPKTWLLWSSSTSKRWLQRLQTYLPNDALIFVSEVNLEDRAGALPSAVWKFIDEKLYPGIKKQD